MSWQDFVSGFRFSIPLLLVLTFHEFGHYFTARWRKVKVTLPYYMPLWFGFIGLPSFGTMGAFIRIKETIYSRKDYFDIGVSGPIAGFIIAIGVIWYGFTHLPEPEYIFEIHPEYSQYGLEYADHVYEEGAGISFQFGSNLIYWFFEHYVVEDPSRLPHPNETIHYPFLLAGYLALFLTAINLLPIGQLDGGHVTFGLFGPEVSRMLNRIFYTGFLFYAGLGWVHPGLLEDVSTYSALSYVLILVVYLYFIYLCVSTMIKDKRQRWLFAAVMLTAQFILTYFTGFKGYSGWLLFAFLIGRFLGVYHPPVIDNRPLDTNRKVIGWISIVIFILCFSPQPFIIK
jgi:membrane-associated protease RseP (regulator of RpoE activity)